MMAGRDAAHGVIIMTSVGHGTATSPSRIYMAMRASATAAATTGNDENHPTDLFPIAKEVANHDEWGGDAEPQQ